MIGLCILAIVSLPILGAIHYVVIRDAIEYNKADGLFPLLVMDSIITGITLTILGI